VLASFHQLQDAVDQFPALRFILACRPLAEGVGLEQRIAERERERGSALSTELTVRSQDGEERHLDGLNRKPGLIRSCGGSGGDGPTTDPKHDFTCTDDSELIHFSPVFDSETEPGDGAEVVLDASYTVTAFRDRRGREIPADGSVLSATGYAAAWLERHAPVGSQLEIDYRVESADVALPDDEP
jgi:hypothetical protein